MIRAYYHDGLIYTYDINVTLEVGDSLNVCVPFDPGFDLSSDDDLARLDAIAITERGLVKKCLPNPADYVNGRSNPLYIAAVKSFTLTEDDGRTDADIEAERIALDAQLLAEHQARKNAAEIGDYYPQHIFPIRIGAHAFFKEDISAAWSRELKRRLKESEDKRKLHAQKDVLDEWEGVGL